MNTITVSKEQIYKGNLLLVNACLPLQHFGEEELIPAVAGFPNVLLKQQAANALLLAIEKVKGQAEIVPVSGYRSAKEQTGIYETSLKESGEEFTKKFVALPYHSEHQTGLAIDLGLKKEIIDFICPEFPYDGICHQFRLAAPDYGFVERYPQKKESVTGIAHEPWHFRYVGLPHSKIMAETGLVLEEYMDFIKQFPADGKHLHKKMQKKRFETFYAAAQEERTEIPLPEHTSYEISGNNKDGFIVTFWRTTNEP